MLYELIMRSTYFGQQIINRFNYVMGGTPAAVSGSFALQYAFFGGSGAAPAATSVVGELLDIVTNDWQLTEIESRAIYSATDFFTRPFITPVIGEQAGKSLSPVVAYGFRTNRVRSDIARGTKRFVGVTEAGVNEGGTIGGILSAVQEVAVAMSEVLEYDDEGNTLTFSPVVVQKEKYTTPSGRDAYRYYSTLATQLEHVASGILWEAYPQVRSQVSRQYGRGS
jgi:hypothetical protein